MPVQMAGGPSRHLKSNTGEQKLRAPQLIMLHLLIAIHPALVKGMYDFTAHFAVVPCASSFGLSHIGNFGDNEHFLC